MSLSVLTRGGGGGFYASIFIIGLSETDTVTATKDGKTANGKWNSAESRFEITKIKDLGTWTVTATSGEKTKIQDVLVDSAIEFTIYMPYILYLYKSGNECKDVTGGWVLSGGGNGGGLAKNSDHMVLTYNRDTAIALAYNQEIPNPGYRTLYAEVKAEQIGDALQPKNFTVNYTATSGTRVGANITSTSYYTQTVDISALIGQPFNVWFKGEWYSGSNGRIYIKNVWLE